MNTKFFETLLADCPIPAGMRANELMGGFHTTAVKADGSTDGMTVMYPDSMLTFHGMHVVDSTRLYGREIFDTISKKIAGGHTVIDFSKLKKRACITGSWSAAKIYTPVRCMLHNRKSGETLSIPVVEWQSIHTPKNGLLSLLCVYQGDAADIMNFCEEAGWVCIQNEDHPSVVTLELHHCEAKSNPVTAYMYSKGVYVNSLAYAPAELNIEQRPLPIDFKRMSNGARMPEHPLQTVCFHGSTVIAPKGTYDSLAPVNCSEWFFYNDTEFAVTEMALLPKDSVIKSNGLVKPNSGMISCYLQASEEYLRVQITMFESSHSDQGSDLTIVCVGDVQPLLNFCQRIGWQFTQDTNTPNMITLHLNHKDNKYPIAVYL